jgi:hypothetical protein
LFGTFIRLLWELEKVNTFKCERDGNGVGEKNATWFAYVSISCVDIDID